MSKICNGLINENYKYQLSGDCMDYCKCVLTNERCVGIIVDDPDDKSSQCFSRGKNIVDKERIKKCPMFGLSVETFQLIAKEKLQKEMEDKINLIGK